METPKSTLTIECAEKKIALLEGIRSTLERSVEEFEALVDEKNNLLSAQTYVMNKRMKLVADVEGKLREISAQNSSSHIAHDLANAIQMLQAVQVTEPVLPQVPKEAATPRVCPACFYRYKAVGEETICPNCAKPHGPLPDIVIDTAEQFAERCLPHDYYRGERATLRLAYAIGDWKRQQLLIVEYQKQIDALHAQCHKHQSNAAELEQLNMALRADYATTRSRLIKMKESISNILSAT